MDPEQELNLKLTMKSAAIELAKRGKPPPSREELLTGGVQSNAEILTAYREALECYTNPSMSILCNTFFTSVAIPSSASAADISAMKHIQIRDLVVWSSNKGCVLLAKVVERPFVMTAIHSLLQDDAGDLIDVSFYGYSNIRSQKEAESLFPVGLRIGIVNPFYKVGNTVSNRFIRVDLPETVLRFSPEIALPHKKSAEECKAEGNEYFKSGSYALAKQSYSRAIVQDSVNAVYYSNRSLAETKLGDFEDALKDAEEAVRLCPGCEKYRFRVAAALYGIRRLDEAEKTCGQLKSGPEAKELLARIAKKKREVREGAYDFRSLFAKAASDPLDVDDFIGPIEIRKTAAMGRGVFATRKIVPGELISLSRAFAFTLEKAGTELPCLDFEMNLEYQKNMVALSDLCARKCCESPPAAILLSLLCDGAHDLPAVDIRVFAAGNPPKIAASSQMETGRVRRIISHNAFGADITKDWPHREGTGSGLWLLPSFYNHSCAANAQRKFLGDCMIVRATREVAAGEEVFLSYAPTELPYDERQKRLKFWGFKCRCPRCRAEKQLGHEVAARISAVAEATDKCWRSDSGCGREGISAVSAEVHAIVSEIKSRDAAWRQNFPTIMMYAELQLGFAKQLAGFPVEEVKAHYMRAFECSPEPEGKFAAMRGMLNIDPGDEVSKKEYRRIHREMFGFDIEE